VNWKLILGWSVLLFALGNGIGFLSGIILSNSEIRPDTIGALVEQHRLFRRIAFGIAAVLCYWRVAVGAPGLRALHVLAAFVLVQLFDIAIAVSVAMVLGTDVGPLFDPWGTVRAMSYALLGYGLAWLSHHRAPKSNPPLGEA